MKAIAGVLVGVVLLGLAGLGIGWLWARTAVPVATEPMTAAIDAAIGRPEHGYWWWAWSTR